jgi:hypothetical protein
MPGKQRASRRKKLDEMLGKEINIVFTRINSNGKQPKEFSMGGILEKRKVPASNFGYYIQGTNVQISLSSVRINPRPYSDGKNNVLVVTAEYSPEKLNLLNLNL